MQTAVISLSRKRDHPAALVTPSKQESPTPSLPNKLRRFHRSISRGVYTEEVAGFEERIVQCAL